MNAVVSLDSIVTIGNQLNRPECVLAFSDGSLCTADWRGGVNVMRDSSHSLIRAANIDFDLRPNGISMMSDGSFLIAHLGESNGGLFRLMDNGHCEPLLTEVDGESLPPSNFPHIDRSGRIWLTISTRRIPRATAYRSDVTDGFIVLIDAGVARVVADNLGYTNECCVSPDGHFLYVNETFARRLSRFRILPNGDLIEKSVVTEFDVGTFPDGLTFDEHGDIWITSIISNRVIRCTTDGEQTLILEDANDDHIHWVETAFLRHSLGREHLDTGGGILLGNISSLAFGGPDLKTAYLGCLLDDKVYAFESRVAGMPPVHWNYRVP
ncbi:MAG: SMP-30/gluconolactonase/LRE family protein [Pseudomonadota bacterium]